MSTSKRRTSTSGRARKDLVTAFVRKFGTDPGWAVTELAELGLSKAQIAAFFGVSTDSIEHDYAASFDKGCLVRKINIHVRQYELALEGDAAMLIWLGKVVCGQCEPHGGQADDELSCEDGLKLN